MKTFRYFIYSLLISLSCIACEEVIELDLGNADTRIVIQGFVTDQPGPYTIRITESALFYDTNDFPPKTGATVIISDSEGNEETLEEVAPGVYQTSTIQGQRGVTYTVTVELDGQTYTAHSTMPEVQIVLDSLVTNFQEESFFTKEGYYATAYFNDTPGVEDYFRIYILVNGEPYIFEFDDGHIEDDNFRLASDKFTDGTVQDFGFPHWLEAGDVVSVELHHLDRSTYDYYRTFLDVKRGGGLAPSNPLTNFDNNALGYFGAISVTAMETVVED